MVHPSKIKIRSRYDDFEGPGLSCPAEESAKQSFKDECDINKILAAFIANGQELPPAPTPSYRDVSNLVEYAHALQIGIDAKNLMESLPVDLLKRCDYDPQNVHDYLLDPKNAQELVRMGLVSTRKKAPLQSPLDVIVTTDTKGVSPGGKGGVPPPTISS